MAELILTFAHAISSPQVIHSTAEATAEVLSRIDTPGQEASPFPSDAPCRVRVRPMQQILFVAGSKRMIKDTRGIEREVWDQQWSYGECIFSKVVKRIGLERFSPRAATPLVAHLVGTMDTPDSTRSDIRAVAHGVACECLSILRLKKEEHPNISRVIVVLPLEADMGDSTVSNVREALTSCWMKAEGPLQGVPISFELTGPGT